MASTLAALKEEWRRFKDDPPGERFERHRERVKRRAKALVVLQVAAGVVLLAGGVVLLFIPGPGLLVMVFGLALIAGVSRRLARLMDRAEPWVRRKWAAIKAWWGDLHWAGKAGCVLVALALAAGAAALAYWWFFVR